MTLSKSILLVLFLLITGTLIFLYYIGLFSTIQIVEKETGPFIIVYEEHRGDYKGTARIQNDIYHSLLDKHDIETFRGFGIYYDDPKVVARDDLRSIAGCILEEQDHNTIKELQEKGFLIKEVSKQNSIVAEFPYKNSFSIIAGIIKVYPEIEKYIKSENLPKNEMMEIYDVPSEKIIYIMKK